MIEENQFYQTLLDASLAALEDAYATDMDATENLPILELVPHWYWM